MNIFEKLLAIQQELKAPKGQYNSFGKYKYRSCEDILEAVKPICAKHNIVLTVSDELVYMGDRYYIKATARLIDTEFPVGYDISTQMPNVSKAVLDKHNSIENTAYAREEESKKGMDGSQITGTASSYARKYALNGLFCIDDTKDADTDEYKKQNDTKEEMITAGNINVLQGLIKTLPEAKAFYDNLLTTYNITDLSQLTTKQYGEILIKIKKEKGE